MQSVVCFFVVCYFCLLSPLPARARATPRGTGSEARGKDTERGKLVLSDAKCNLLMCRMLDVSQGHTCNKLLCKTHGLQHDGCRIHGLGKPPNGCEMWVGAWLNQDEWTGQVNAVLNAHCLKQMMPFADEGDSTRFPLGNEYRGEMPEWMRKGKWSLAEAEDRRNRVCIPEWYAKNAAANARAEGSSPESRDAVVAKVTERQRTGAKPTNGDEKDDTPEVHQPQRKVWATARPSRVERTNEQKERQKILDD